MANPPPVLNTVEYLSTCQLILPAISHSDLLNMRNSQSARAAILTDAKDG